MNSGEITVMDSQDLVKLISAQHQGIMWDDFWLERRLGVCCTSSRLYVLSVRQVRGTKTDSCLVQKNKAYDI